MKTTSLFVLMTSLSVPAFSGTLNGKIRIDGSSTVNPITEAVSEEFRSVEPRVRVSIGISGTGGGFKKFLNETTDINNASRPIKAKESEIAKEKGIEFMALPVAYDGMTVVVKKDSPVNKLTLKQLNQIWKPKAPATNWKQLGFAQNQSIELFGPGPDSGTFDFFTKVVNGKSGVSRSDYGASEDDNVIVKGVSSSKFALGYFGYAYYKENTSTLKAVTVDGILPTENNVRTGKYPLSRKIYIYVSKKSAQKPEVKEFVNFYLKTAKRVAKEVGYIALSDKEYQSTLQKFNAWASKKVAAK